MAGPFATWVVVTSGPELLPKPMPVSVLMSMVPVTTEGYEDAQGLGHHMWLYWCERSRTVQKQS